MIDLKDFRLAKDLYAHLDGIGVIGQAADAIRKETAEYRQAWRTCRAEEVALEKAREGGDKPTQAIDRLRAAALLHMEGCGVGGRMGVQGGGTARMSPFDKLGKGRKNASDGPAWTAAISQAASTLSGQGFHFFTRGESLDFSSDDIDGLEGHFEIGFLLEEGNLPWAITVAREGLRRSLRLKPWFESDGSSLYWASAEAAAWAGLVNALAAAQEETETEGETL